MKKREEYQNPLEYSWLNELKWSIKRNFWRTPLYQLFCKHTGQGRIYNPELMTWANSDNMTLDEAVAHNREASKSYYLECEKCFRIFDKKRGE